MSKTPTLPDAAAKTTAANSRSIVRRPVPPAPASVVARSVPEAVLTVGAVGSARSPSSTTEGTGSSSKAVLEAANATVNKVARALKAKQAIGVGLDALNAELESAETALRNIELNVAAHVRLSHHIFVDGEEEHADLAWRPGSRGWRLVIEEGSTVWEEEKVTEVCRGPKELRILAAQKLPELLDAIIQRAEAEVEQVDAGIVGVRAFTVSLAVNGGGK